MTKTRNKKLLYIFICLAAILLTILLLPKNKSSTSEKLENIKLDFPSNNIDPEKMWRSYLEDKLEENKNISDNQIEEMKEIYQKNIEKIQQDSRNDIDNLRQDFSSSHLSLKQKIDDIIDLAKKENSESIEQNYHPNISISNISDIEEIYNIPFDRRRYIAETSYVTGVLIGGIAVSTSIGSASSPVPIIIRITDRGNLPKNFSANLKKCRILGSSYGDLSSERAVVRAESLVCEEKDEVITTRIAGIVYGDDGMNGIRGRVIDMSSKHIRNAAFGSMLSAFGNSLKSEGDLSITPFGAINKKSKSSYDNFRENSLKGAGNAAEKIADYYIKQAENMSPVLQIPGGTKVDVVFTKGAYLGSRDIVKRINSEKR